VIALILAAFAVGLDNLAVSIGIGLAGVDARAQVRITVAFGVFEGGMPLVGLLIGHGLATSLSSGAGYVGGALLIAVGLWAFVQNRRNEEAPALSTEWGPLLVTALALSTDNLVVGFGLGVTKTPLAEALVVFTAASVVLTLLGLQFGRRLGDAARDRSGDLAATVLVVVGVLLELGVF
jgi:manganese efflux pump family protein